MCEHTLIIGPSSHVGEKSYQTRCEVWGKGLVESGHQKDNFCCSFMEQEGPQCFSYENGNGINHISNWVSISILFYSIVLQIEDTNYKFHIQLWTEVCKIILV